MTDQGGCSRPKLPDGSTLAVTAGGGAGGSAHIRLLNRTAYLWCIQGGKIKLESVIVREGGRKGGREMEGVREGGKGGRKRYYTDCIQTCFCLRFHLP